MFWAPPHCVESGRDGRLALNVSPISYAALQYRSRFFAEISANYGPTNASPTPTHRRSELSQRSDQPVKVAPENPGSLAILSDGIRSQVGQIAPRDLVGRTNFPALVKGDTEGGQFASALQSRPLPVGWMSSLGRMVLAHVLICHQLILIREQFNPARSPARLVPHVTQHAGA